MALRLTENMAPESFEDQLLHSFAQDAKIEGLEVEDISSAVTFVSTEDWENLGGVDLVEFDTVVVGELGYIFRGGEFNQVALAVRLFNYLLSQRVQTKLKIGEQILVAIIE